MSCRARRRVRAMRRDDGYTLTATVSPPWPAIDALVTVTATLTYNGQGVAGAVMDTTWNLIADEVHCSFGVSGPW